MLFVLSPAKSLDYESALPAGVGHSQPLFTRQAQQLIDVLRTHAPQDVAQLMSISDKLAALNVARYGAWSVRATRANARPALFAFNGDVYEGLQAHSLSGADVAWAQQHLIILSGLYGVLRPLDLMQPYRLEMGTRLATSAGATLYAFWRSTIAEHLNQRLAGDAEPVLVNLASQEYFKSIDRKALKARVVECVFEDAKGSAPYKIVSFYAKRARGLMARWALQQRAQRPAQLQGFDAAGYAFAPAASTPERLVFRRRNAA